jgi:hypothetical protein
MPSVARLKLRSIVLMSALSLLAWSAATPSEAMGTFPADAPEVVVQTKCPPIRTYSSDVVTKAGGELRGLLKADPTAAAPGLIADYKMLRDQCRAYQAK